MNVTLFGNWVFADVIQHVGVDFNIDEWCHKREETQRQEVGFSTQRRLCEDEGLE